MITPLRQVTTKKGKALLLQHNSSNFSTRCTTATGTSFYFTDNERDAIEAFNHNVKRITKL